MIRLYCCEAVEAEWSRCGLPKNNSTRTQSRLRYQAVTHESAVTTPNGSVPIQLRGYHLRFIRNHLTRRRDDQLAIRGNVLAFDGDFLAARQLNRQVIQEAFGVDGCHAARAGGSYCLAID